MTDLRAPSGLVTGLVSGAFALVLGGCPAKATEQKDAQAPERPSAADSGPLATLESEPFAQEAWTIDGQPAPMIHWARQDVRVSASCRAPDGRLRCDALQQLRGAPPIEIARRALDGRQSAGVKACMQSGRSVLIARNPGGSEDSFCRFQDGSMVSTGALEQYGVRIGG